MMALSVDELELAPLRAVMTLAGAKARLIEHRCGWHGDGAFRDRRHDIELSFVDDAVSSDGLAFLKALRAHEFELPGLMVASIGLTRTRFCPGPRAELFLAVEMVVWELPHVAVAA